MVDAILAKIFGTRNEREIKALRPAIAAINDLEPSVQQLSDTGNLALSRPNGQLLTPSWSVSEGTVRPETGDTATWSAPAKAGTYQVVLIVSDGAVRAGQQITLDVVAASP